MNCQNLFKGKCDREHVAFYSCTMLSSSFSKWRTRCEESSALPYFLHVILNERSAQINLAAVSFPLPLLCKYYFLKHQNHDQTPLAPRPGFSQMYWVTKFKYTGHLRKYCRLGWTQDRSLVTSTCQRLWFS